MRKEEKNIFENEIMRDEEFVVDRNASEYEKMQYKKHFFNLQVFLQFYKEKLMLTKKVNDALSKHVVTMEQLQKEKEGYTDQF